MYNWTSNKVKIEGILQLILFSSNELNARISAIVLTVLATAYEYSFWKVIDAVRQMIELAIVCNHNDN